MADGAWPGSLPAFEVGLRENRQPGKVRTATDYGPGKQRRRFTATSRYLQVTMVVTAAQRATFDTFYEDTMAEGVLTFTHVDPKDGQTRTFRFGRVEPSYEAILGDNAGTGVGKWRISFEIEKFP